MDREHRLEGLRHAVAQTRARLHGKGKLERPELRARLRLEERELRALEQNHVSLTRDERERVLDIGRAAGDLESAKDAIMDALGSDPLWSHLESEEISEYAWAAAKWCYPREYNESWR